MTDRVTCPIGFLVYLGLYQWGYNVADHNIQSIKLTENISVNQHQIKFHLNIVILLLNQLMT